MTGAGNIFRRSTELHCDRGFGDHVAGVSADQMHAEHAIGLCIRQNLDETIGGLVHFGAAIGGEGKLADIVI